MNKIFKETVLGLIVGVIVGFAIRYFRGVTIAPFICGIAGAIVAVANYKKKQQK